MLGFGRVAVLCDKVAGVAGEGEILDWPLGSAADLDHFTDTSNMVLRTFPGVGAGFPRALHHLLEVLPVGVAE